MAPHPPQALHRGKWKIFSIFFTLFFTLFCIFYYMLFYTGTHAFYIFCKKCQKMHWTKPPVFGKTGVQNLQFSYTPHFFGVFQSIQGWNRQFDGSNLDQNGKFPEISGTHFVNFFHFWDFWPPKMSTFSHCVHTTFYPGTLNIYTSFTPSVTPPAHSVFTGSPRGSFCKN